MADSQRLPDETDAEREERIIRLTHDAYTTPSDDPGREYCRLREYSVPVILGGLDHLLNQWERAVAFFFNQRYAPSLAPYQHDMDCR